MARCAECMYFRRGYRTGQSRGYAWATELAAGESNPFGRCQYNPPVAISEDGDSQWPVCHEDDWCHEWVAGQA